MNIIIVNKNHFEFLYIIGRGGFGRVWKVKLKSTNDFFAAKVMSKAKIISSRSEENIMGERNILSKIHHQFIVNMYFSFQDYDNLYLLMDLLSGGDLRYHLSHKKPCVFNEIQTKFFISNVILALEYIHSQKIIHRDIKPENLVLDINGYVRLTDFGIAVINDKNEVLKESSGTAGYMAPEVMLQQGHSYPADFFALGVIGYEFMIGNRPYYGKNRKQIKNFILSYQAKIKYNNMKKGWSENSKDFINRLLQRRPVKRLGYSGIKELKNHPWLKDIDWDLLRKKKIRAPYIPKEGKEFFDKKYCEEEKTEEKYKNLINVNGYQHAFKNYTFINLNYISKFNNEHYNKSFISNINHNDKNFNSLRQMSFSESLIKGRSFSSTKNIANNSGIKINKNYFSANKLSKTIKRRNDNCNEKKKLSPSKDYLYNSTNQIRRYYNIGLPKEKENNDNNEMGKTKEKESLKDKIRRRQLNKHCFSSDNLMKEKCRKQISIKDVHRLIEKSLVNSPLYKLNNVLSNNNTAKKEKSLFYNKNYKSSKAFLKKSKSNRIMLNEQKSINNEKEKELLFNSTTKEKTTKEKTTDNKDKNVIKKINKKITINNKNNKNKVIKNEESKYSKNLDDKNKTKDSFFQNQFYINNNNDKKSSLIHSRNKIKKKTNSLTKEISKTNIKNNNNENDTDYHIKVIHKKIYKVRNEHNNHNKDLANNKKDYTSYKPINKNNQINKNISMIKSHSNKNYMTINSISMQKTNVKSTKNMKNVTYFKKNQKINGRGRRTNKLFKSKGFDEFRKRKIKNFKEKPQMYKSLSNFNNIKEKKEKKIDKEIKENKNNNLNNNDNDDKIKKLKFDDYFRNTGLDKESNKNNYYILDKFVSI